MGGSVDNGNVWKRLNRSAMPTEPDLFLLSDGRRIHQLASDRLIMIGGYSPSDQFEGGLRQVTNEVWSSDDDGETWELLAEHVWDATTRFAPQHCALSGVYQGQVFVCGAEPGSPGGANQDVWRTSDGENWTKVGTSAPTDNRLRGMCGTLGDDIYIMGGDVDNVPSSDVWRSTNGGVSWTQLDDAPWDPRGMVYSPVQHAGKLFVVGGAIFDPAVQYNDVWSFDGSTWTEVLADGHEQFEPASFHQVVSLFGRLWIIGGFNSTILDLNRAVYSDDDGVTWQDFDGGSGLGAAHADAVVATGTRILRIEGSAYNDRTVYSFERVPPETEVVMLTAVSAASLDPDGGTVSYLSGSGFTGVTAVAFADEFTVDSDNQITATFGAHAAGTVNVYVTHPTNGRSNAISIDYAA
jgi:hypothetical protein